MAVGVHPACSSLLRGRGGGKQPAREDDHSLLPRLRISGTTASVPRYALTLPRKDVCGRVCYDILAGAASCLVFPIHSTVVRACS